jgi:hypothetical protein
MKLRNLIGGLLVASLTMGSVVDAASMKISIGIRENNGLNNSGAGPAFSNGGGSGGGIEFVNRDGQTLNLDGTWQLFTFTPATDPLLAFAGTTANSALEPGHEWTVLEHIRLLNDQGITKPIRLWIDDVTNTDSSGSVVESFESNSIGSQVMFRQPGFSGSTSAFLVGAGAGMVTVVSNSAANSGSQSLQADFQFANDTPTNWLRLTTANTPTLGNPLFRIVEPGAAALVEPGAAALGASPPTLSFYVRAVTIPEPASLALVGLAGIGLACLRTRK